MQAKHLYKKDQKLVVNSVNYFYDEMEGVKKEKDLAEAKAFFNEHKDKEYSEFLELLNDKYGYIIQNYSRHIQASKINRIAMWVVFMGVVTLTSLLLCLISYMKIASAFSHSY